MKLSLWYPIKPAFVNQYFGDNAIGFYISLGMKGHNGWDFQATDGQPIRAAHDGVVTFTGEDGSGGLGVVVRTTQQYEYEGGLSYFKTVYWHCQKGSFQVKPGDQVFVGKILARADNTGMSTGTHLHFGLKPILPGENDWEWFNIAQNNGYFGSIDPKPYFNKFYAEDSENVIKSLELLRSLLEKFIKVVQQTH